MCTLDYLLHTGVIRKLLPFQPTIESKMGEFWIVLSKMGEFWIVLVRSLKKSINGWAAEAWNLETREGLRARLLCDEVGQ